MPNYQYDCPKCGQFEGFQLSADRDKCPRCGKDGVRDWLGSLPQTRSGEFQPYWQMWDKHEGTWIASARQLDKECEQRGLNVKKAQSRGAHPSCQQMSSPPPTGYHQYLPTSERRSFSVAVDGLKR